MTPETHGRATSIAELRQIMSGFMTPESFRDGLAFTPRATDVFVATYPKCGTTLLQQIVHGLRTRGDMDFEDISAVIPWIEFCTDLEIDPAAEQRANPRAFKTHLNWDLLPKGGRSIYVLRDPEAALVSFYHFFSGWFFEPGAFDLETFALEFVLPREGHADYWSHLLSFWPHRNDPEVLYLLYEDVVADLPAAVRRVAAFLGFEGEEDRIEMATQQASIDFMRSQPTLWEDELLKKVRNPVMGLSPEMGSTKLRKGSAERPVGELTNRVIETWQTKWRERVEPVTGCKDYAALRAEVNRPSSGA